MKRALLVLLIGAVLGSVAGYQLGSDSPRSRFPVSPVRDIQHVPEIGVVQAEALRRDRYESVRTIEDILSLPTDFAETEALYAVAGRSDSSGIQDLIYQAVRISDRLDRFAALNVLLTRLTELDPYSALAISRDPALGNNTAFEGSVWLTWGRLDLDDALLAAMEGSFAEKNIAAQALYSSVRELDSEKLEMINQALGIKPGPGALAQQIYALADKSMADAVRFIESQGSLVEQQERIGMLAQYLASSSLSEQSRVAELFQSQVNRMMFEQSMASYSVQSDPEAVLEKLLAKPGNPQDQTQMYLALQYMAQQDPDKALAYLDRIPDFSVRQSMASIVVSTLAATDPQRALAWVRENDQLVDQSTLGGIIGQIAVHDVQLAMTEAQAIPDSAAREQAITMIVMVVSQSDPEKAARMLDRMSDSNSRGSLIRQVGQQWSATDFEGAMHWVASLSEDDQRQALQGIGPQLVYSNVDRAIALLEQFPNSGSGNLKIQIAQNLAEHRSIEAAQSFIANYKGTDVYPRLQMTVISNLANSDPDRALRLAESVQDTQLKDQLVTTIVARKANEDPQLALQWMESISNSAQRQQAISQIVMAWHSKNPGEANAWVSSLPRGTARDDALIAITMIQSRSGADTRHLIDTIDDPAKRKQAALGAVQRLIYTDAAEAELLLKDLDLTDAERLQYQQMLDHARFSGYGNF